MPRPKSTLTPDEKRERSRVRSREWYEKNKHKVKARTYKWREENPELNREKASDWYRTNRKEVLKRQRDRRLSDIEKSRRYDREQRLKRAYGITPEQRDEMEASQSGVCKICLKPPSGRPLCVDHCHDTGAVRGLLCTPCNLMIGYAGDSADILLRAIEYLKTERAA